MSAKGGCIWAKWFYLGKMVLFGEYGSIWANWYNLGKRWLYLLKIVLFGQISSIWGKGGCIWANCGCIWDLAYQSFLSLHSQVLFLTHKIGKVVFILRTLPSAGKLCTRFRKVFYTFENENERLPVGSRSLL